jgi:hypothetical protein
MLVSKLDQSTPEGK